jgi:hypothetical protein
MTRPRQRGWQPLLWTLLAFVIIQVGLGLTLETSLEHVRDAEYANKERQLLTLIADNPGRPLILVLGSSRTMLALKAGQAEEDLGPQGPLVFNFGLQGAGPLRQWTAFQRLRDAGVKPAFVFVEVLPPLLNRTEGPPQEEWWLHGERLTQAEIRDVSCWHSNPSRLWREWGRSRLLPAWCHGHDFRVQMLGDSAGDEEVARRGTTDSHGWQYLPTDNIREADIQKCCEIARAQYLNTFRDFRLVEPAGRALENLLSRCRDEGIPTALMLMPEGSRFRGWCPPGMIAGYEAWLHDVCSRTRVPLLDARRWIADDGFWDSHHLMPSGAVEFTRRWTREATTTFAPQLAVSSPRGRPTPDTVPRAQSARPATPEANDTSRDPAAIPKRSGRTSAPEPSAESSRPADLR